MIVPDTFSRAYAEEVDVSETESFVLDLNSNHFQADDYKQIRQTVVDNPERFPDLKVDDHLVFK